jgi:pyruvate formate lyase activating enzyme
MNAHLLRVGGVTPFSATDYPGQLAVVVFVEGCAWRCGYCHNPALQTRSKHSPIPWPGLLQLLQRRIGLIDAVVFSGGEPTTDPALADAMVQARELGFRIGLHTACIYPNTLKQILPRVDWVGFDVKAPFDQYASITGARNSGVPARAGVRAILDSGVAYECRTTVHPTLLAPDALFELAETLAAMGVANYALQEFRAQGCGNARLNASAAPGYPDAELVARIAPLFKRFELRHAH